jgi:flavin reductase
MQEVVPGKTLEAAFKDGMRRLAAAVNVITICVDGTPMGMTATAVTSLAAEPPSLLVCINRSASMHSALIASSQFAINVLHSEQLLIAQRFSDSKLRDVRFAEGGWVHDATAAPYLPDAQVAFSCQLEQVVNFATHTICIGRVTEVRNRDEVDPLMYVDGRFSKLLAGEM